MGWDIRREGESCTEEDLGLVLGVLLGRGPRGSSELEALLVGEGRLLGLELSELVLHVLVVGGGLALLGTSSTGLLGRHCDMRGWWREERGLVGWMDGWRREGGKGRKRGTRQRQGYLEG